MDELLLLSKDLDVELSKYLHITTYDQSGKLRCGKVMCQIAYQHSQSAKLLIASRNYASAIALIRLQYESLVRAGWVLYVAKETNVNKLMAELSEETAQKANKLPMLSQMLTELLDSSAPKDFLMPLIEFKKYSWKPLSSFVHAGIHVVNRQNEGYPVELLKNLIKMSNALSIMGGMLQIILHGGGKYVGEINHLGEAFSRALPEKS